MAYRRTVAIVGIALAAQAGAIPVASATPTQDAAVSVVVVVYSPGPAVGPFRTTIGELESGGCPTTDADPPIQGGTTPPTGPSGGNTEWALSTFLTDPACLPGTTLELSAINAVTVAADGQPDLSASAQLTPGDLAPQGNPDAGPVFWDSGSAVSYVRPPRSATDDNAADTLTVGQSLQFDVYENESPAAVDVTASATAVAAGVPVTFTASVPGGVNGESYAWDFDDGTPIATGTTQTASFPTAGTYQVTVQATGPSNGFGQILIQVGSPATGTGTTTTPAGPAVSSGTTPGGPVRKRRRRRKVTVVTRPTVSSGAPTMPKAPPRSIPTQTPTPKATPATAQSSAAAGTRRAAGGRSKVVVSRRHRVSESPASGPATSAGHPGPVLVRGRLLGSVETVAGGAVPSGRSPAGAAAAVNRPGGAGPWAAILSGMVVLGLLGLGAGRELRSIRFAP